MNKLDLSDNLYFSKDFSFLSQFSSGIEYCHHEKQIDISIDLLDEDKQKIDFSRKINRILAKWKKGILNYYCQQIKPKENILLEKSQLLFKKLSTDTAWVSSLLALTSVGIASEVAPLWSQVNQNLSLKSPLLKTSISLKSSADRLFPLFSIEEIKLITSGGDDTNNGQNRKLNKINSRDNSLQLVQPKNSPLNQEKWFTHQTKANGSLMAIPPMQTQPSLAAFPPFLSTLNLANSNKYSNFNQFNSFNKHRLLLSYPLDSVTYNIEDKLMATPKTVYIPYLTQNNL